MSNDKIRIKLTPRQNDIIEDINYVAMTEHPEEEWAQYIKNEVDWRRTYINAPREFWEQVVDDIESYKDEWAQAAMESVYRTDDERKQQFVYDQALRAYNNFAAKIKKALDRDDKVKTWKKSVTPLPAPVEKELVDEAITIQRPVPQRLDENRLFIGISPTGTEWVHYLDQNKNLEDALKFFVGHWKRWMSRQSPEELQRVLQNPRNEIEEQFVKLVEKPAVRHQGSVFRFVHR
jgi:hypothetical protein